MILIRIMIGLASIGMLILILNQESYDSTDNVTMKERSGLRLYTDHRTGCQYIGTFMGAVTPRLDKNGKHICD